MSQDGERLARVETKVETLEEEMKTTREEVRSINKQIWMASGAVAALMAILKILGK